MYFWGFIIFLFIIEDPTSFQHIKNSLIYLSIPVIPVYLNFYIFEKFFFRKQYFIYAILLILIIFIFTVTGFSLLPDEIRGKGSLTGFSIYIMFFIFVTTALKIGKRGLKQNMLYQELQAKHFQTELNLLKSQIHPHFLFNTLNNLFSMAKKQDDQSTANGIAKLAHLMRYMIYDSSVDRICLQKEIEQINSFLELQKLRFTPDDDIKIDFEVVGRVDNIFIPPMLLIPFIENAFKHSVSLENPTHIDINIKTENESISFSVKNTVNQYKNTVNKYKNTLNQYKNNLEENDSGLGLSNVKRRLELLYPDTHNLKISDNGEFYQVSLQLFFSTKDN